MDQRVDRSPIDGRSRAVQQYHAIDLPDMRMAKTHECGHAKNQRAARNVKSDTQVAAVHAVDEDPAEKGNDEAGQRVHNDGNADADRRMRDPENVPGDAGEVHPGAEHGNKRSGEKIAEAGLSEQQRPIGARMGGGGHRIK